MAQFSKDTTGRILKKSPSAISYSSANEGAIYNNNNTELRTQIQGADRAFTTNDQTQTLTNKTISGASNTLTNLPASALTGTVATTNGGTGLSAIGTALQVLRVNAGATALEFASAGTGDVTGPASSTDNGFAKFDGTTGKLLKDSAATISNSDVNASAAIAYSKLATLSTAKALVSDGSGFVSASTVTTTELGYVSGVTSAIQTQFTNKQPLDATLTSLAAYNTNGILTQTAADTFAGRTITASTGISISNGDGVAGNPTISSTITQYTDEMAQDAVGTILTDSATIDFTYNDAGNTITAAVITGNLTSTTTALTVTGGTNSIIGTVSLAIADASASVSGLVNTTTQTFAGLKTFPEIAIKAGTANSSTGNLAAVSTSGTSFIEFTGAAPVIQGFANSSDGKELTIVYTGSGTISLQRESSSETAANRIETGTDGTADRNITFGTGAVFKLQYLSSTSRWRVVSMPKHLQIIGLTGSARSISAGTGLTSGASHMSLYAAEQHIYVTGNGGAVTITANPAISDGTYDGQIMVIMGTSDTNTVAFTNGNNVILQGNITLGNYDHLTLRYNGTDWVEKSRSN